jgi:hypothetical protein
MQAYLQVVRWSQLGCIPLYQLHSGASHESGSSTFAGANAERRTVVIDLSHSFLIVWLGSVEIHRTAANIIHCTVAISQYCSTH